MMRFLYETNTVRIVRYVKGVLASTASGGSQIGDFVSTLINIAFHKWRATSLSSFIVISHVTETDILKVCILIRTHVTLYSYNNQHSALIRYFIFVLLPYMFRVLIQPIIKRLRVQCGKWWFSPWMSNVYRPVWSAPSWPIDSLHSTFATLYA
jgi:hypothetical protein